MESVTYNKIYFKKKSNFGIKATILMTKMRDIISPSLILQQNVFTSWCIIEQLTYVEITPSKPFKTKAPFKWSPCLFQAGVLEWAEGLRGYYWFSFFISECNNVLIHNVMSC